MNAQDFFELVRYSEKVDINAHVALMQCTREGMIAGLLLVLEFLDDEEDSTNTNTDI